MQPIRIVIPGDFWDMQIYRGRLYLWSMDADVTILDWDGIINSLVNVGNKLPMFCAFSRGDFLYGKSEWSLVFDDVEFKTLLTKKFDSLVGLNLQIDTAIFDKYRIGEQSTPFGCLHDDCDILSNKLYAVTEDGFYSADVHLPKKNKYKIARQIVKHWDGLGTALKAGSGAAVAIAAANDGLYEYRPSISGEPQLVSSRHTTFVNWAFASLYGSSDLGGGYLAAYYWNEVPSSDLYFEKHYERTYATTFDESEIFSEAVDIKNDHLTWASQEKIYSARSSKLEIVNFTQKNVNKDEEKTAFQQLPDLQLESDTVPINAGTAYFGTIIEYENYLLVCGSNGQKFMFDGPIVRWRVYPRSKRYENHIHILYEDRLEILSFNHDYFVDQWNKSVGIRHRG